MNIGRILLAGLLALPLAAQSEPLLGAYVSLGAGANALQQQKIKGQTFGGVSGPGVGWQAFGLGPAVAGAVGWGFGNGLRLEVEGNWRENGFTGRPAGVSAQTGREEKMGAIANLLFDLDFGWSFGVPYLGGGVGYEYVRQSGSQTGPGGTLGLGGSTGAVAWQGIAGMAMPVAEVPGLAVTAEYRFLGLSGDRVFPAGAQTLGRRLSGDDNHAVFFGLRYAFDAPGQSPARPAPLPPPPAAAGLRTYLVFFDWDSDALSDRAKQIIGEAAGASTRVATTRIELAGHADRTGSAGGNLALSRRRAEAVAGELVRRGVPAGAITVEAFGDSQPLIPAAAGLREAQNRRVHIVLR